MTRWPVLVACALIAHASSAAAQSITYTGSLGYASDRYIFTEPTHSLSWYNSLHLTAGRLRVSAGIPLVWQDSWAVTYVGGVPIPTAGPDHEAIRTRDPGEEIPMTRDRSGRRAGGNGGSGSTSLAAAVLADSITEPGEYELNFADPLFTTAIDLVRDRGALRAISMTAAMKPPLASTANGMSTGAWDFGAGASVVLSGPPLLLYADVVYWSYGDYADLELLDGFTFTGGLGIPLGHRVALMASISAAEKIIATMEAARSVAVLASYDLTARATLSAGGTFGLSEAVSGASFFLGWSFKLSRPQPVVSRR